MRRNFSPEDLENIKELLFKHYGFRVGEIVQGKEELEIYHSQRSVLSPIRVSYDSAREMLKSYLRNKEEKMKLIAKIKLTARDVFGDSNLYTIPASLMEDLQFKLQKGMKIPLHYLGKIRPISDTELSTMGIEELKSVEQYIADADPDYIVIIPKNIIEEDVDKIIPDLEVKLERFSQKLEGADLDTYSGLPWLFEEEIQEIDKTASMFNLSRIESLPRYILNPFGMYPLRNGYQERIVQELMTDGLFDENIVYKLIEEFEEEELDWERHKVREEF